MKKLSDLAKQLIIRVLIISLICVLGAIIYHRSFKFLPFFFGAVLGSLVSIIKVLWLDIAINKAVTMEKNKAGGFIALQQIFRLALTGFSLYLGAVIPVLSIWGVAAGIFAFPIATYTVKFTKKNKE